MKLSSLEEIIRRYVPLNPPTSKGWETCVHLGCDKGHKGPRAGFLFEGETVAFHCFNCSTKLVFAPSEIPTLSENQRKGLTKKWEHIFSDFNIPNEEWQQILFALLANKYSDKKKIIQQVQKLNIEPESIPLPPIFYFLKDADPSDKWAMVAREYLKLEREIDPTSYPFMLSRITDDIRFKKWKGRVIIPIYKGKTLIFYIGRDLTEKAIKKYESPSFSRDCVLYGFDQIQRNTTEPLFVVEGWFDAFAIDGVALLGNEFSKAKIEWLNRSPRQKIYIPDRFGDGHRAAIQALNAGWSVSTPDTPDCKDMSDAVQRYGKLYVLKSIIDNTCSDELQAKINVGFYCV